VSGAGRRQLEEDQLGAECFPGLPRVVGRGNVRTEAMRAFTEDEAKSIAAGL
jgi:hypothetical protein